METIDGLPPESRFLLRALAAGLSLADAAALLGLGEDAAVRRLRSAAAQAKLSVPAMAAGDAALLSALAPLRRAAARAPTRTTATACPGADVTTAFAAGRLAGPLLLATAEHAADCPHCLERVLAEGPVTGPPEPVPAPRRPRRVATIAIVIALLLGALLLATFV